MRLRPISNGMKKQITIDAKNKKLGRLASEAALALRGKTEADFLPYVKDLPRVTIKNVDLIAFSEKRLKESDFLRYSGYPGGLKKKTAFKVAESDKREVLRHAINGMLPKNKLRKVMLKNLTLEHGDE